MMKMKNLSILMFILVVLAGCKEFIEPSISKKQVVLLAPVNGTESVQYAQNFWWEEVEDALKYRLQVVSPSFDKAARLVLDTLVMKNKFKSTLDPGTYEWRVSAENGSSKTPFTKASFIIYATSIKLQQPQLQAPANGTSTNINTTTFSWLKLFGADKYHLQIDTNNFADEKVLFLDKTTPNLEYNVTFNKDKLYTWRVKALNDTAESKWSAIQTIAYDGTPPVKVNLSSPATGAITTSPVTLKWDAVSTAIKYQLFVYKSDQKTPYGPTYPLTLTGTSYSFTGTIRDKVYWQVKAIDAAGNVGAFSDLWNFSL